MATRTFTFDTSSDYAPVTDLVVNVGASFTCSYTVNTVSGSAFDFTGFSSTCSAKMAKYVGTAATATFNVGFSSEYDGKFYIGLTSTQTDALTEGRYVYDVNVKSGVGTVYRLVEGQIVVKGGISSTL